MIIDASARLNSWLNEMPKKEKLDFSPESLRFVEKLILNRIENKQDLLNPGNKDFLLGSLVYIGEVFKRNDSIRKLSWTNVPEKMPILTCRYHSNSWVDIFQKFPSLVHKKTGQVLIDYFQKNLSYFKENSTRLLKESVDIPGTSERNYHHLLYDNECLLNLQKIKNLLVSNNRSTTNVKSIYFHDESHLLIDTNKNYYFHFATIDNNKIKSNIDVTCDKVTEFWGDEDPDGQYLNEYLFILQQLSVTPLYAYDTTSEEYLKLT